MSNRGGKRENAGRPRGQGKFGEPTVSVRIPQSQGATIKDFLDAYQRKKTVSPEAVNVDEFFTPIISDQPIRLPLFSTKVAAGFPSPADDHVEKSLDISEFMIDHAASTFFVTIKGDSMIDVGLLPGDKVVVDRSKTPGIGDIVLAVVDREFTIKILDQGANNMPRLMPANSTGAYRPIYIRPDMQFEIFGVVTGSFRRFK
jgi:DNA polymerase V